MPLAVTAGPGLYRRAGGGSGRGQGLALALDRPIYGSTICRHVAVDTLVSGPLPPGCVALLVSGGHRLAAAARGRCRHRRASAGATIDDAAGEAFDKVARLLGLPFPGGPPIDEAARSGDATAISFPAV